MKLGHDEATPPATSGADERPPRDLVDAVVDSWHRRSPNFDPTVKQLAIRLSRAAHHLRRAQRLELAAKQIESSEYDVLVLLFNAEQCTRSAGELARECQVTSGAITNRVARLEERGWVQRDIDPSDRRQILVSLTPTGRVRVHELLDTKSHADESVFGRLDEQTRKRLNTDLRTLLLAIEGPADDRTDSRPDHLPDRPARRARADDQDQGLRPQR
jgi:DNA-binding MarR family transcriptional regulator